MITRRAWAELEVPSPTFTIMQQYDLPGIRIIHADCYRFGDSSEWVELGIDDMLDKVAMLIEWSEIVDPLLPVRGVRITLEDISHMAEARTVTFEPLDARWQRIIARLCG
jgi:tRNA threonylcarbamoyl adenosine modification protein YjeE